MSDFIAEYQQLRKSIDERGRELVQMHEKQLNCKAGCDSCCESIRVFPVEFFAIKKELAGASLPAKKISHKFTRKCRFLSKGKCLIYNSRPIICRTQGLPLLYENETGTAHELSVCQLNFKGVNPTTFSMENALFMPPFNSRLFLLNKAFVEKMENKKYTPQSRLRLNDL